MVEWRASLFGLVIAILSFVSLGTVSALWKNPLFIRMTPAGGWEIGLLAVLSILIGVYVAIPSPLCRTKTATTGGIIGFLGIACPVCNKILLLIFGGELLMAYFEPVRVYFAAFGVAVTAWAVWWTWQHRVTPETHDAFETPP